MPTYEYECKSCGHSFDVFQSMKDDPLKSCTLCGKEIRRLINGGSGVIFKGGGFYVTDKSSSSKKPGGKTENRTDNSKPAEAKAPGSEGSACTACVKSETCPKAVNS